MTRMNRIRFLKHFFGTLLGLFLVFNVQPYHPTSDVLAQSTSVFNPNLTDFKLIDANNGWFLKENRLFWTSDGGYSWSEITPDHEFDTILSVSFMDTDHGRIVTALTNSNPPSYEIVLTDDAGKNWTNHSISIFHAGEPELYPSAIFMDWADINTGWVVFKISTSSSHSLGTLIKTADGGRSWVRRTIPIGEPPVFINSTDGWVAGGAGGNELYRTTDGGVSWASHGFTLTPDRLIFHTTPTFFNDTSGILPVIIRSGASSWVEFHKTTDSGNTWIYVDSVIYDDQGAGGIPSIKVLGIDTYLVITPDGGNIIRYEKGRTNEIKSNQEYSSLTAKMLNGEIGLASSFTQQCTPISLAQEPGEKSNLACSTENKVLKTENGGVDWITIDPNPPLMRLMMADEPDSIMTYTIPENSATATNNGLPTTLIFTGQGFDSCNPPSISQMQDWWNNSPYEAWNIYMGGGNMGCKATNIPTITTSYIASLAQQGWKFIPLWVGKQAPCSTGNWYKISYDLETAYGEGVAEADAAADRATGLGLGGTIIYFDIEAYDTSNSACRAATKSFVSGWTTRLHTRGFMAGIYGASCAGGLADFDTLPEKPDALWIANWIYSSYNPAARVYGTACFPDSLYNNHQRIRQYSGDHNETWGNTTWNIDCDVFDGIVAIPGGITIPAPSIPDLSSPTNSVFLNEGTAITLSWNTSGSEYYGQVYGAPTGTIAFGWTESTSYSLGALPPGYTYAWHVKARTALGESAYSSTWSFSVRPAIPTNLTATAISSSQINLNWVDNSSYENGYNIFRDGVLIASIGSGSTSYQDTGLLESGSHSYQVKSYRGIYESLPSNTAAATLSLDCFTLTLTASPAVYGKVTASPLPNCNNGTQYERDTVVTITAVPATSTAFNNWGGTISGNSNPYRITMNTTQMVIANFSIKTYSLVLTTTGNGSVISNPVGINCGNDCSQEYNHGTLITLTASAASGNYFSGWGGDCSGNTYCGIIMSGQKNVSANFGSCYGVTTLVTPLASGNIRVYPTPNCGGMYKPGTIVTVTAYPSTGFALNQWMGDATGGTASATFVIDNNKIVMAEFLPCHSITVNANPINAGRIIIQPTANCGAGYYRQGTSLTITATPNTGSYFLEWSGTLNDTENPTTFVVNGPGKITGDFVTLPSIPILLIPAHNSLVLDQSIVLDWSDAYPNLHHYEMQIARDSSFTDLLIDQKSITSSTYKLNSLPSNSQLFWRVRAVDQYGFSRGWSTVRTILTAPQSPKLATPLDGEHISTLRPVLSWDKSSGALSYNIQISKNNIFTLLLLSTSVKTETFTVSSDLPANSTLYWRVQVRTSAGLSSWSELRSFTTSNPPSSPVLLSPLPNTLILDASIYLDWRDVSVPSTTTFQKYELQIATDNSFSSSQTFIIEGSATDSHYQLSGYQSNTKLYWRVRAANTNGDYSAWSLAWLIRIALPPPTLNAPANNSILTNLQPTFDWQDVPGCSGYTLQISRNENFTLLVTQQNLVGMTNSSFTPSVNLPINQTLYWRVRTNGVNGPSSFSPAWSFQVPNPPNEPILLSPINNTLLTDLSPTLIWSKAYIPQGTIFDHYQLQVAMDPSFLNIVRDIIIVTYETPSYTVEPDLPLASQFFWRVRLANTLGQTSAWSKTSNFNTSLTTPILISPTNNSIISSYRPVFDWEDVPGATSYTLQITSNSSFTINWLYVTITSSTYISPTDLPVNIPLYWRVRANNSSNYGTWSSPGWSFTINP